MERQIRIRNARLISRGILGNGWKTVITSQVTLFISWRFDENTAVLLHDSCLTFVIQHSTQCCHLSCQESGLKGWHDKKYTKKGLKMLKKNNYGSDGLYEDRNVMNCQLI